MSGKLLEIQFLTFGYSCLLGVILGIIYDIFRILRMIINSKSITMFVQDVIYFVISGIITFVFVLEFNSGESRFYILAGEAVGWILYHITVGESVYRCSWRISQWVKNKIRKFYNKTQKIFVKFANKKSKNEC